MPSDWLLLIADFFFQNAFLHSRPAQRTLSAGYDKDTPVTVFIGEDSQRSLSERVVNFLPRICGKYNIIDTNKFELKGISPEYRGYISHLVMHAVTQRIDAHMEKVNCHPMEIRRYYRCLDY